MRIALVTVLAFLLPGPAAVRADDHAQRYLAEIDAWRAERVDQLLAPDGYLNLAGLYWLGEGEWRFGSDADNDLVFPAGAPPRAGRFVVSADGVTMYPASDDVRVGGATVDSLVMTADDEARLPVASVGSLAWTVIERAGRYAVRLRDFEHPALRDFPAFEYFPVDDRYRVEATLRPFEEPRVMQVDTVIEGLGWNPVSPGVLEFELDGQTHSLEAYASGERLFIVFGDITNGRSSYPAGRFVYADAPGEGGRTVIDFNKAYSPPCAFNDFSTCPVATPRNRLRVAIEAGEKYTPERHAVHY